MSLFLLRSLVLLKELMLFLGLQNEFIRLHSVETGHELVANKLFLGFQRKFPLVLADLDLLLFLQQLRLTLEVVLFNEVVQV